MPGITVALEGVETLANLRKAQKDAEKALRRTMQDIRSRGPTWIAKGVAEEYNLKPGEITGGGLVSMRVRGQDLGELEFQYKGRLLTPSHFSLSPKAPRQGSYTLKATIKRGQRATLGSVKKLTKKQRQNIGRNFRRQGTRNSPQSPPMLAYTGNKQAGGTNYIPFQRTRQPGNFDKVIKTISVPQMIQDGSGTLKPAVRRQLNENIQKRFDHYTSQIW